MLEVVEHLETVSNPGTPCPTSRRPQLKRMLLKRHRALALAVSARSGLGRAALEIRWTCRR